MEEGSTFTLRGTRAEGAAFPSPESSEFAAHVKQFTWTQAQLFGLLDELAPGWRVEPSETQLTDE